MSAKKRIPFFPEKTEDEIIFDISKFCDQVLEDIKEYEKSFSPNKKKGRKEK